MPHVKELLSERTGALSVDKMRNWLRLEEGIVLSPWKTRQIKGAIEIEHHKIFDELKMQREAERASKPVESAPPESQSTAEAEAGSDAQESSENKKPPP